MRQIVRIVASLTPAVFALACGQPAIVSTAQGVNQPSAGLTQGSLPVTSNGHIMAMTDGPSPAARFAQTASSSGGPDLVYYGGPIISNVEVFIIQWGAAVSIPSSSGTATVTQLGKFFSGVTTSTYWSWLTEYNTSSQTIGKGSYIGTYVDTSVSTSGTVDDTTIQSELNTLISSGKVPENSANMLYFFYFPPNITVTMSGQASCEVFCAYHSTAVSSTGAYVYYGVIPDQGGSCAGGCGGAADQFDNTTSVSSHELAESTTDSAVGQANGSSLAAPLAWYDQTNGEIGDICNAEQGTVTDPTGTTWTIQLLWSNQQNACVSGAAN